MVLERRSEKQSHVTHGCALASDLVRADLVRVRVTVMG